MNRLLMNCDQVFDVLTRGPFPTGAPEDAAVERHLRACFECRQLAEALQPAVALLHEAVDAKESLDLPKYQGTLPGQRSGQGRWAQPTPFASCAADSTGTLAPRQQLQTTAEKSSPGGNVRWIALSLLIVVAITCVGGLTRSRHSGLSFSGLAAGLFPKPVEVAYVEGVPGERSLLTLASLQLPAACLPLTHRATTAAEAAQIAEALASGSLDALRCCTACHHAGQSPGPNAARFVAMTADSCRACHRG